MLETRPNEVYKQAVDSVGEGERPSDGEADIFGRYFE